MALVCRAPSDTVPSFSRPQDIPELQFTGPEEACLADVAARVALAAPDVAAALGRAPRVSRLAGGYCNDVLLLERRVGDDGSDGGASSVVVKRTLPWVRREGPSMRLPVERMLTEAAVMRLAGVLAPGCVPRVLAADGAQGVLVMEHLRGHETLSAALARGAVHGHLGPALGAALGALGAGSAPEVLGPQRAAALAATLAASEAAAELMVHVVFVEWLEPPPAERAGGWPPGVAEAAAARIHGDSELRREVAAMRAARAAPAAGGEPFVLAHTDVWPTNILVAEGGRLALIDCEFACMAPASYDVGHALATLLLGAALARGYAEAEAETGAEGGGGVGGRCGREAQERWLLGSMEPCWDAYAEAQRRRGGGGGFASERKAAVLAEALGFAGVIALRWTFGRFHAFDELQGAPGAHAMAMLRVLAAGRALLLERRRLQSAGEVAERVAQLFDSETESVVR